MPNAITLRPDFDAPALRGLERRSKDAAQARSLLSLAVIYDGGSRTEATLLANVTLQIVRDWVARFNAEGSDELRDRKAPGLTPRLNEAHRAALLEIIECGPTPAIYGVVRWRITDLGQWLWEEFRVSVSPQTLSRVLRGMGLRKLSARPKHHAQAEGGRELDPAFQASLVMPATPSRGWDVTPPPASQPPVPPVITAWKGKAALRETGLLDAVEVAVAAAFGRVQDAWTGAPEWNRESEFLSDLAVTLGQTDMDIDRMFLVAAWIRS